MLNRNRAISEVENIVNDHLDHHGITIMGDRAGLVRKLQVHLELCLDAEKNELPRDSTKGIHVSSNNVKSGGDEGLRTGTGYGKLRDDYQRPSRFI